MASTASGFSSGVAFSRWGNSWYRSSWMCFCQQDGCWHSGPQLVPALCSRTAMLHAKAEATNVISVIYTTKSYGCPFPNTKRPRDLDGQAAWPLVKFSCTGDRLFWPVKVKMTLWCPITQILLTYTFKAHNFDQHHNHGNIWSEKSIILLIESIFWNLYSSHIFSKHLSAIIRKMCMADITHRVTRPMG